MSNNYSGLFQYIKELRKSLMNIVDYIDDAIPYTHIWGSYSDVKYSSDYKKDIKDIFQELISYSEQYSLYIVDVYNHKYSDGYECAVFDTKNILGKPYKMGDLDSLATHYSKYNEIIYTEEREVKCPACRKEAKLHEIYKGYIIINENPIAPYLKDIIYPLFDAMRSCCYKGRRSVIRENILKAIVNIDNLLLDTSLNKGL